MGIIDNVYPDGVPVQKGNVRADDKAGHRRTVSDANVIRSNDFSGQFGGLYVVSLRAFYDLDTSDQTTPDDGVVCIIDNGGNRFKQIAAVLIGKRQQVRVATTANITISTALNNGDTLDGVTLATNDLVLVKDQTSKQQNGIYVVGAVPARAAAFDTYDEHAGAMVAVVAGTSAGSVFFCTANAGGTLDTTAIDFTKLAATEGADGSPGEPGEPGPPGPATITIGTVTTLAPGEDATVTNSGDEENVILDFGIPEGEEGERGIQGEQGIQGIQGDAGIDGDDGEDGWSPVFAVASDGARRVLQVTDWTGGTGTKPATGKYVGASGLETLIANGIDIRGATGASGSGTGDMEKATYDSNDDGKFENAVLANMADGTVKMRRAGAGSGVPTDTTLANLKTDLSLNNVTNVAQMPSSYLDTDTTLAANSDTRVASQKAVKAYADALIAANDAMVFKGVIDCSANPNYPAADRGWTYKVSVAGKIGGASGVNVEVGDILLCITDSTSSGNQATVGSAWNIIQANVDGAVIGPGSATSGALAKFNGTTGKIIEPATPGTDFMKPDTTSNLTKGFTATEYDAGTKSSGTFTPDPANGNLQKAVNGGAHTLAPPSNTTSLVIQYTNNGSAGTITTSGFTRRTGDVLTTVNGDDFLFFVTRINGFSHLHVQALQ